MREWGQGQARAGLATHGEETELGERQVELERREGWGDEMR
jgi:hypothetical protein